MSAYKEGSARWLLFEAVSKLKEMTHYRDEEPELVDAIEDFLATDPDTEPCECGSLTLLLIGRRVRRALLDVAQERKKQDAKWGDTLHPPEVYLAILIEEVGELGTAILAEAMGGRGNIREELVQVAAVAARMIELCDRKVEGWKTDRQARSGRIELAQMEKIGVRLNGPDEMNRHVADILKLSLVGGGVSVWRVLGSADGFYNVEPA